MVLFQNLLVIHIDRVVSLIERQYAGFKLLSCLKSPQHRIDNLVVKGLSDIETDDLFGLWQRFYWLQVSDFDIVDNVGLLLLQ